jgi:cation/acetate symporter
VFCLAGALMLGTAGLPHVIVRFYTVKSVRAARYSAFWALLFIAILYTAAPALAMFARYNLIDTLDDAKVASIEITDYDPQAAESTVTLRVDDLGQAGYAEVLDGLRAHNAAYKDQQKQIAEGVVIPEDQRLWPKTVLSGLADKDGKSIPWATSWQRTELLVFDDKNNDSSISLKANDKKFAEASVDRDIIVLATPEVARLAPWVIGLVAAGGLAAALSTAAGLLLVISSSIAHDLFIHYFNPNASEKVRLGVARVTILFAIIIAGYFGVNPPGFVGEVVAFAFGLAAASFFPAILLGIFDARTNRQGAVLGMIVGIGFTGIYILGNTAHKIIPGVAEPWFGAWFFGIGPQGIGLVGCAFNFIITLVVSRLTPPPPAEIQQLVESVRLPVGAREPEAHYDENDAEADAA